MRVYFVTKRSIIKILLILVVICTAIFTSLPYMGSVSSVFSSNRELPIYSVETPKSVVSFTFDCAWGGDDIPEILNILDKYGVKATFFLVGDWMNKYPDNAKMIDKRGHEIANHSDTHPNMAGLKETEVKNEITNANNKILNLTGKTNTLFRAPYGEYNNTLIKTAKTMGMYTIQWDVDSLDWKELGVNAIIDRVGQKAHNGSIILFHNDTKYTVAALPTVIENLKNKGYQFAKVSDMIIKNDYYIDYKGVQKNLIRESWNLD